MASGFFPELPVLMYATNASSSRRRLIPTIIAASIARAAVQIEPFVEVIVLLVPSPYTASRRRAE